MDDLLTFARGPLFALTFGIMVIGLLRLFMVQIVQLAGRKGRRLTRAPWGRIMRDSLTWALPLPHLIKGTILFSSASFILHIGLVLVPVFLVDHVALWERLLGVGLPSIGRGVADVLTLTTLVCLLVLLGCRTFLHRHRAVSEPIDYLLLILLMIPFGTGYLALHPGIHPFSWSGLMLTHLLSAELLFVLVPFTKLAHVVLFVFDRISAVHWQLRPGAGDQVAQALFGEKARV